MYTSFSIPSFTIYISGIPPTKVSESLSLKWNEICVFKVRVMLLVIMTEQVGPTQSNSKHPTISLELTQLTY